MINGPTHPDQEILSSRKAAILVSNGFDESQMTSVQQALMKAGAAVDVVSPIPGVVHGWRTNASDWGNHYLVNRHVNDADAASYDALFLPGGEISAEKLCDNDKALAFVRSFVDAGKPVAVMTQGATVLAAAGVVEGRAISTSVDARGAVEKAGGSCMDQPVTEDGTLLTSPDEDTLPGLIARFIDATAQAKAA